MPILIKDRADFTPDFRFLKSEFTGTAEQIIAFKRNLPAWFTQDYSVVQSNAYTLAVTSKKASKGAAVKKLAEKLGFDQSEVIIFGDQGNDLSMFQNPHFFKVAMKNGIEPVRSRANFVTLDNNHDGVALALNKFVLK
jgi:HAD superfamily hydrolase (TIGR01484 family)